MNLWIKQKREFKEEFKSLLSTQNCLFSDFFFKDNSSAINAALIAQIGTAALSVSMKLFNIP